MRLGEKDLLFSQLLLKELTSELLKPEVKELPFNTLQYFVDEMEFIKQQMQIHYLQHRQDEVAEQMIGFDALINYVRKLQNKDVASM
jgi:hypothetical protein